MILLWLLSFSFGVDGDWICWLYDHRFWCSLSCWTINHCSLNSKHLLKQLIISMNWLWMDNNSFRYLLGYMFAYTNLLNSPMHYEVNTFPFRVFMHYFFSNEECVLLVIVLLGLWENWGTVSWYESPLFFFFYNHADEAVLGFGFFVWLQPRPTSPNP